VRVLAAKCENPNRLKVEVRKTTGRPFYNTSNYSFADLLADADGLADNLTDYMDRFSADVDVFEYFDFKRRRKSMCFGRRAISSPQRIPVSMKVSTISRCCSGTAAISRSNSSGVRVRDFRATTFGSSVWSHGLWTEGVVACSAAHRVVSEVPGQAVVASAAAEVVVTVLPAHPVVTVPPHHVVTAAGTGHLMGTAGHDAVGARGAEHDVSRVPVGVGCGRIVEVNGHDLVRACRWLCRGNVGRWKDQPRGGHTRTVWQRTVMIRQ
jgi:hypothetical protein